MVVFVEWRPMTHHRESQNIPLFLDKSILRTPSLKRAKMDRLGFHLGESSREFRVGALLPVAYAISMVERDLAH